MAVIKKIGRVTIEIHSDDGTTAASVSVAGRIYDRDNTEFSLTKMWKVPLDGTTQTRMNQVVNFIVNNVKTQEGAT